MRREVRDLATTVAKRALENIAFIEVTMAQVREGTTLSLAELQDVHQAAQEAAVIILNYNREQH